MGVHFRSGDLFESGAAALVNPVNCFGVAGAGLAKQFRLRFEGAHAHYSATCARKALHVGSVLLTRLEQPVGTTRFIVHFPTKLHWRDLSKYDYVDSGLNALQRVVISERIPSVAIPALGCGLGELVWSEIKPLIEVAMHQTVLAALAADFEFETFIYLPWEAT